MRIVVMNFSGNVGKSTVSEHLLKPRFPGVKFISVESINADDSVQDAIRGKDFSTVTEAAAVVSNLVVDVGASNVEDFLGRMKQYRGSHEDLDLFLIPTVPSQKQQVDTVSTIEALSAMGIPGDKIRVVFNRVESEMNVSKVFAKVLGHLLLEPGSFEADPTIFIEENEVYAFLEGQNLSAVAGDPTPFEQKIREASSNDEKLRWAKKRGLRRLAMGAKEELDVVFRRLLPEAQ
jgi:hypothetical protein